MFMRHAGARCRASLLLRSLARAGAVGLVGGGLVLSSVGAALAKSDLSLSARHTVVRAGRSLPLKGWVGDDGGFQRALFCLQMRTSGQHWHRTGPCVAPSHVGRWSAGFRLRTRPLTRGRYAFRAMGVDPGHRHGVYGPSRAVHVTVR